MAAGKGDVPYMVGKGDDPHSAIVADLRRDAYGDKGQGKPKGKPSARATSLQRLCEPTTIPGRPPL